MPEGRPVDIIMIAVRATSQEPAVTGFSGYGCFLLFNKNFRGFEIEGREAISTRLFR